MFEQHDRGGAAQRHIVDGEQEVGDTDVDPATVDEGLNAFSYGRDAPFPEIDRVAREPRPRHRERKRRAAALRNGVTERKDALAARQAVNEPGRVIAVAVRRDERDRMTARQLVDDLQASDRKSG